MKKVIYKNCREAMVVAVVHSYKIVQLFGAVGSSYESQHIFLPIDKFTEIPKVGDKVSIETIVKPAKKDTFK